MNYESLIKSIKERPNFFLRNQNLEELDAFLRGTSYINFVQENTNQFRDFCENWFPRTFPKYTHDWLVTLREMSNGKNEWELFFELWDRYVFENKNT